MFNKLHSLLNLCHKLFTCQYPSRSAPYSNVSLASDGKSGYKLLIKTRSSSSIFKNPPYPSITIYHDSGTLHFRKNGRLAFLTPHSCLSLIHKRWIHHDCYQVVLTRKIHVVLHHCTMGEGDGSLVACEIYPETGCNPSLHLHTHGRQ